MVLKYILVAKWRMKRYPHIKTTFIALFDFYCFIPLLFLFIKREQIYQIKNEIHKMRKGKATCSPFPVSLKILT